MNLTPTQAFLDTQGSDFREKPNVFSNSWAGFLKLLLRRNSGYLQRKFAQYFSELVELGCLAYVFEIEVLKNFLILPFLNLGVNAFQEIYWQWFRLSGYFAGARARLVARRTYLLGSSLLILSSLFLVDGSIFRDWSVGVIFSLRLTALFFQIRWAPSIIEVTSRQRVRPSLRVFWGTHLGAWLVCIAGYPWFNFFVYAVFVPFFFNAGRVLREWSFLRSCRDRVKKERLLSPSRDSFRSSHFSLCFMILVGALELLQYGIMAQVLVGRATYLHFLLSYLLCFFLGKSLLRFSRSLLLDLDSLIRGHFYVLLMGIRRRLVFISIGLFLFSLSVLQWVFHRFWLSWSVLLVLILMGTNLVLFYLHIFAAKKRPWASVVQWMHLGLFSIQLGFGFLKIENLSQMMLAQIILFLIFFTPLARPGAFSFMRRKTGALYVVDWVRFNFSIHQWVLFKTFLQEMGGAYTFLNRRRLAVEVSDELSWRELFFQFSLNLRNGHRVPLLQARSLGERPEGAKEVHLDWFGFWRGKYHRQVDPEISRFFHSVVNELNWKPFWTGSKPCWSYSLKRGARLQCGPTHLNFRRLWFHIKGGET